MAIPHMLLLSLYLFVSHTLLQPSTNPPEMKGNRAPPGLISRIVTALSSKTNELKTRIMIFFLLHRSQGLLVDGMHTMLGNPHPRPRPRPRYDDEGGDEDDDMDGRRGGGGERESFVVYTNRESETVTEMTPPGAVPHQVFAYTQENAEGNYRDLTHALFKESEEEMELTGYEDGFDDACNDGRGSPSMNEMLAILEDDDMRLNEEADNEDVDQAADLFIERFKRQMKLQKQ